MDDSPVVPVLVDIAVLMDDRHAHKWLSGVVADGDRLGGYGCCGKLGIWWASRRGVGRVQKSDVRVGGK